MSTSTERAVTRVTVQAYRSRYVGGKARRLCATIGPGDVIVIKPLGLRSKNAVTIDINAAWEDAASRAMRERMGKLVIKGRRK